MTKSTITRERMEEIRDCCWMDDLGLSMDELSELARMALAAMDSEPVIIVGDDGGDALSYRRLIQSFAPGTKLYRHAQPAPVLPEEATPDSIEILASARRRDHAVFQWDEDQRNAAADSWNAFRAAMLQELKKSAGTEAICRSDENVQVLHTKSPAQSDCCPAQNSVTPAQNQGWIPVSERMPENDGAYLCWDNRYVTTYAFIFGAWQANQFIAKNITHWMPLPAGPQEVR
ncbi:DUF551 domain-containing protein [Klebsiella pneumoniae]|nr:DUF551 domain-containing protein [Klebsiella pneumoniae]PLI68480.1 hypothetical protein B6J50_07310 [Klebsiella pneumoniae]HBY6251485.1 DUF551 domain-containing protein [Klebsiella pneumoniae]HCK7117845.1 DUF551 domain-containing protein [Klebsiella pneumoniae]HCK7153585.1 DUF551 domain-containing protein [Klebsiella pneumoniae]